MSPHYTMRPRIRFHWKPIVFNLILPALLIHQTAQAWITDRSTLFYFLATLTDIYITLRIAELFSRRRAIDVFFAIAAVQWLLMASYTQVTAENAEDTLISLVSFLMCFICALTARVEYQAGLLHSLTSSTHLPAPTHGRNIDYPGIYRITCIPNGMEYIGQTSRAIKVRWHDHESDLNAGRHHNTRLQHDWNLYRPEQFRWEVLEVVTDQSWLLDRERDWQNREYETAKRYNPPTTARTIRTKGTRPRRK